MKRYIFAILLCLNANSASAILKLDRESTEFLIGQFAAVVSTRDFKEINAFLKYYALAEAKFTVKSIAVDADQEGSNIEKETEFTREEYAKKLAHNKEEVAEYYYEATLDSFKLNADGKSAVAGIKVREVATNYVGADSYGPRLKVKSSVFANCNMGLTISSSTPLISGMSCIEKVVIE